MSYWAEMGLFVGKAVIIVISIVAIIILVSSVARKSKEFAGKEGRLIIKHLNNLFNDARDSLRAITMDKKEYKKLLKAECNERKKAKKEGEKKDSKSLFVIDFHGDIKASAAQGLAEEVSAILAVAKPKDEVLVKLESQGGMVHSYGFAAAQLERIIKQDLHLVVAVDKVAASGGYMMACIANKIIAAPFAVIGSIGVIGQLPNVNKLLKKNNIEIEQHTAGEYKRTLTILGENNDKGRAKFLEDLEKTHGLFKKHVVSSRKNLDISEVATGEVWYGQEALEKQLVDTLGTSSEYLFDAINNGIDVYQVKWETKKKGLLSKLGKGTQQTANAITDNIWEKLTTPNKY